jgi:hypothetical protein
VYGLARHLGWQAKDEGRGEKRCVLLTAIIDEDGDRIVPTEKQLDAAQQLASHWDRTASGETAAAIIADAEARKDAMKTAGKKAGKKQSKKMRAIAAESEREAKANAQRALRQAQRAQRKAAGGRGRGGVVGIAFVAATTATPAAMEQVADAPPLPLDEAVPASGATGEAEHREDSDSDDDSSDESSDTDEDESGGGSDDEGDVPASPALGVPASAAASGAGTPADVAEPSTSADDTTDAEPEVAGLGAPHLHSRAADDATSELTLQLTALTIGSAVSTAEGTAALAPSGPRSAAYLPLSTPIAAASSAPLVVTDVEVHPMLRGSWEQHTSGIGSRLMARMGYVGGALGRPTASGRLAFVAPSATPADYSPKRIRPMPAPIEPEMRPARAGLGTA